MNIKKLTRRISTFWVKKNENGSVSMFHRFDMSPNDIVTSIDYKLYEELADLIAENIANKIAPSVKQELLKKKEVTKLLNEVRLLVAKKLIEK